MLVHSFMLCEIISTIQHPHLLQDAKLHLREFAPQMPWKRLKAAVVESDDVESPRHSVDLSDHDASTHDHVLGPGRLPWYRGPSLRPRTDRPVPTSSEGSPVAALILC